MDREAVRALGCTRQAVLSRYVRHMSTMDEYAYTLSALLHTIFSTASPANHSRASSITAHDPTFCASFTLTAVTPCWCQFISRSSRRQPHAARCIHMCTDVGQLPPLRHTCVQVDGTHAAPWTHLKALLLLAVLVCLHPTHTTHSGGVFVQSLHGPPSLSRGRTMQGGIRARRR